MVRSSTRWMNSRIFYSTDSNDQLKKFSWTKFLRFWVPTKRRTLENTIHGHNTWTQYMDKTHGHKILRKSFHFRFILHMCVWIWSARKMVRSSTREMDSLSNYSKNHHKMSKYHSRISCLNKSIKVFQFSQKGEATSFSICR